MEKGHAVKIISNGVLSIRFKEDEPHVQFFARQCYRVSGRIISALAAWIWAAFSR